LVNSHDAAGPDNDPLLSREHVMQILHRAGLDQGQIATILEGMEFPSRLSKIQQKGVEHGLSHTELTDRLGGSP
jgi:hypothetical protein